MRLLSDCNSASDPSQEHRYLQPGCRCDLRHEAGADEVEGLTLTPKLQTQTLNLNAETLKR